MADEKQQEKFVWNVGVRINANRLGGKTLG